MVQCQVESAEILALKETDCWYSGTSLNGHSYSEHLIIQDKMLRNLQLSKMQTPRYFVKQVDFAVPLVPGLCKIHSIMGTLAGLLQTVRHH